MKLSSLYLQVKSLNQRNHGAALPKATSMQIQKGSAASGFLVCTWDAQVMKMRSRKAKFSAKETSKKGTRRPTAADLEQDIYVCDLHLIRTRLVRNCGQLERKSHSCSFSCGHIFMIQIKFLLKFSKEQLHDWETCGDGMQAASPEEIRDAVSCGWFLIWA